MGKEQANNPARDFANEGGHDDHKWLSGAGIMDAVYGPGFSTCLPAHDRDPWLLDTVEHLFADIWSRPGLSIRDRRLLVLGATAAIGREDLIRIQARGGLANEEFTTEQLNETVLHLAYYVGWGNTSALANGIRGALADHQASASTNANPDPATDEEFSDDERKHR